MEMPRAKRSAPLLAVLCVVALVGCGGDNPEDAGLNGGPPTLPGAESMIVGLAAFEDGGAAKSPVPIAAPADSSNFVAARLAVAAINTAVIGFAAAPVAAFSAAIGTTPVQQPDGSWDWSYSMTFDTLSLNLVLNGRADAQGTHWAMRVTTTGLPADVSDFLWYTGEATLDGDVGNWQFYDITAPETPTDLARVDWSIDDADTRWLYWVNNRQGGEHLGDGVTYSVDASAASVTHLDASALTSVVVAWDLVTTSGSLTAPGYNGGAEACWQENHLNTDCAP